MNEAVQFLLHQGYLFLFLWVLAGQLGLPIPTAPLVVAAGALAGLGNFSLLVVFLVAFAACLFSDFFWYEVGFRRGSGVLSLLCRVSLDPDSCVRRTKAIFVRHGTRSLLVAKFIPGLNTVAPPLAGIFHLDLPHFLLFDGLGAFFWVGIYAAGGYLFSHEIEHIAVSHLGMGSWIAAIVPGILVSYFVFKYVQRRRFLRRLAIARITPDEVKRRLDAGEDLLILDVRDSVDFQAEPYTIAGAYQVSIEDLNGGRQKILLDREIILFCS